MPPDSTLAEPGNAPAYSVSELAFALRRTLEDAYGFVRLRGEISKVTRHASGHVYLTLKDDKACIDGVVWKGSVRALKAQPEQGLEVIATGRITTYPARSSYQMVIESLEPAGVGALLAQLERLKVRLRGEGLFEAGRKRPLPPHPAVIGVVTSPTGAVIRDILHRLADRWPCHVVVWPVVVQGEQAAAQVAGAIAGFNGLSCDGPVPRPDLLIVARGGGSIEDLWPFNDEALARAVVASALPLISAVGHETDTTLIDLVSDRRAPTPTAAAEMATPVLSDLRALVLDYGRRTYRCTHHGLETRRTRLAGAARGLPRPADLLAVASQRYDLAAGRLTAALERNASAHERALTRASARLTPALLQAPTRAKAERLANLAVRLGVAGSRLPEAATRRARLPELGQRADAAVRRRLSRAAERLGHLDQMRASLDPDRPLNLGFARVHRSDGRLARSGAELSPGEALSLVFADRTPVAAHVDGAAAWPARPARRPAPALAQGDLF
ncbi:exodeoxyribonuclease VII large subunit [Caulobacter sp. S45]|uniref:exodeoxyribonuclease VII large subunit n=1 Tax=Caulobacter sp. S45 TaxID=1641861 RepID=UPI001576206C|nr:exodeoxyribonuclease VII large subunit [Caulobacter sp. S45]